MDRSLTVSKSVEIKASKEQVWDALTNPKKIKQYLYGTEAVSDWKVGSAILFHGEYDGQQYKDVGTVLKNTPYQLLKYDYLSSFSGLENKPENYSHITYKIEETKTDTILFTWLQAGFANETGYQHTNQNLLSMLKQIKKLVEEE